jgi:hypothetical protein
MLLLVLEVTVPCWGQLLLPLGVTMVLRSY